MGFEIIDRPNVEQIGEVFSAVQQDPDKALFVNDLFPSDVRGVLKGLGRDLMLVATLDGEVVAAALLGDFANDGTGKPTHFAVRFFYVLPKFRGKDTVTIAKAFIAKVLGYGFRQFFATSDPQNERASHFFQKLGLHHVGMLPKFSPEGGELRDVLLWSFEAPEEVEAQMTKEPQEEQTDG